MMIILLVFASPKRGRNLGSGEKCTVVVKPNGYGSNYIQKPIS